MSAAATPPEFTDNHLAFVMSIALIFAIGLIAAMAVGFGYRLDGSTSIQAAIHGSTAFATVLTLGIALLTAICLMT